MLGDEFQFGGLQVDFLRNEQRLHLQIPFRHRCLQLLVQDPFVECVLIDHLDSVATLDHDVAVVHLDGAFPGTVPRSGGSRRLAASSAEIERSLFGLLPQGLL